VEVIEDFEVSLWISAVKSTKLQLPKFT